MATKPICIYGVLSKITLAEGQLPTSQTTPDVEDSEPVKAKPVVPVAKKMVN